MQLLRQHDALAPGDSTTDGALWVSPTCFSGYQFIKRQVVRTIFIYLMKTTVNYRDENIAAN